MISDRFLRLLLIAFLSVLSFCISGCGGGGPDTPDSPPSSPSGLEGTEGYQKAYLRWNTPAGAASYNVYQSTDNGRTYEKVISVSQNNHVVGNLENGNNYYFKVTAANVVGESSPTPSVGVIPGISISSPYTERLHVYKGQLHAHSTNSDGDLTPMLLLTAYRNLGYDFLVISDHNALTSDVQDPGILQIGGVEETAYEGHIVAVNAQREQSSLKAQTIINNTAADGGLAILSHPNYESVEYTFDELMLLNGYTALEIYNALVERVDGNGNAEAKWDALLSAGRLVYGVAVDDMHSIVQADKAWIKVFADNPTKSDLVSALKNGNFYSTTGPDMSVQVSGNSIFVQADSTSTIEFISIGGNVIKKEDNVITSSYTFIGDEQYVRIRITRNSDSKKAWSNPIILY